MPRTYVRIPIAERLAAKLIVQPNGCIEFMGSRDINNYGQIAAPGGRGNPLKAHRVAWELVNGPIPDGLYALHHCDNPPCCNVDHLFVGTQRDNGLDMSSKLRAAGQRLTHCINGHEYTPENTIDDGRSITNGRTCLTCLVARKTRENSRRRVRRAKQKGELQDA